jgi:hypothetical protein
MAQNKNFARRPPPNHSTLDLVETLGAFLSASAESAEPMGREFPESVRALNP